MTERRIAVDTEHFAVRFLVPVLTIGLTLLAHLILLSVLSRALDGSLSPECIVLPVDLIVLVTVGYGSERLLKRLAPSRRHALLDDGGVALVDERHKPAETRHIQWAQNFSVQAWRFTVKRRTRVPKGWLCLAAQLLQDETDIIFYTFMSPEDAEKMAGYQNFTRLRPRKETQSNTDLSAAAQQRRLLKLEDERWNNGAEIKPDDFRAVVHGLSDHAPGWE